MVNDKVTSEKLEALLRIYDIEPLGQFLIDYRKWSVSLVGTLFAFLFFGVLFILHQAVGHQTPANFADIFAYPPSSNFYYPNLIGISMDLIFHPVLFVFLFVFRRYIPLQFRKLEQDGQIMLRKSETRISRLNFFLTSNYYAQLMAIIVIPIILGLVLTVLSTLLAMPKDIAWWYSVILTFIGNYGRVAIVVYVIYIFLILNNFDMTIQLKLKHPDYCSGLAPLGNLAIAIYTLVFYGAVFQAIITSVGGDTLAKALTDILGSGVPYLLFLFPLILAIIFEQLIYHPHILAQNSKTNYLEASTRKWIVFRELIMGKILAETSEKSVMVHDDGDNVDIDYNTKLLDIWATLDDYISEANTWPVSRRTFSILVVVFNPIVPFLVPVITAIVKTKFP